MLYWNKRKEENIVTALLTRLRRTEKSLAQLQSNESTKVTVNDKNVLRDFAKKGKQKMSGTDSKRKFFPDEITCIFKSHVYLNHTYDFYSCIDQLVAARRTDVNDIQREIQKAHSSLKQLKTKHSKFAGKYNFQFALYTITLSGLLYFMAYCKIADTSKQRFKLKKKMSLQKAKLEKLTFDYKNKTGTVLTQEEVMFGKWPWLLNEDGEFSLVCLCCNKLSIVLCGIVNIVCVAVIG